MKKENRRAFLMKFGLTVGALTFGADRAAAFLYQKKSGVRRAPVRSAPDTVDFRYSPGGWHSPIRHPDEGGQSFIARTGGLHRTGGGRGPDAIEAFVDGAGEITALSQRCEEPHFPLIRTSIAYGEVSVDMTAFSSVHEDEGPVDNITVSVTPAGRSLSLRLVVRSDRALETEIEKDGDAPRGTICFVTRDGDSDHPFLILDAEPVVSREGGALILTVPVAEGPGSGPVIYQIRVPRGDGDTGDIVSGARRLGERAARERERWALWKPLRGPSGWNLPGTYGQFSVASARVIDQMKAAVRVSPDQTAPMPAPTPPDLVDEHFISEAELYLGREKEAKARLEAVWKLENDSGTLIGAGGEANMKEMCAAVYSLCRNAELTGDWTYFNELYPDAFNAVNSLRLKRDRAAALPEPAPNARRKLLPEGSPGVGWDGIREEMTNTLWALIALKPLLEISDRHFLLKKSEIREFYGQLRLAFISAARETLRKDPAGFSWFPVVSASSGVSAAGDAPIRPQSGLGSLALGLFPGSLFKKDDDFVRDFPALVNSSLREEIPAGTGPGSAEKHHPVDGALAAQSLIWFGLPEEARKIFIGYLNHASPVYTWVPPALAGAAGETGPGAVDLRASAECVRYLRHAMVLEDNDILRLLDGIARADLADARMLRIERTPTRWGLVSVSLEPADARAWKVSFLREPVNPEKAPPLKSVELPRVLGPNFRFDTITPVTAIKNGPRVVIDGAALRWEAILRDRRR